MGKNVSYLKLKAFFVLKITNLKFYPVSLPSRKLSSFCNFSDVIECLTIYGKGRFLEYLKSNNEYLLETWIDFRF